MDRTERSPAGTAGSTAASGAGFTHNDVELLAVVLFWAFNFVVVKPALREMAPQAFNIIRFVIASSVLLILTRAVEGPIRIHRADWTRLAVLGLIGHTVYQICFIEGLARTAASSVALIFGSTPIVVALLSHLTRHERIRLAGALAVLLGFFGVYLIVQGRTGGDPAAGGSTLAGNLLIIGAVLCWSTYTVSARDLLQRYSPLRVTAVTVPIGTLLMAPLSLPVFVAQDWEAVSGASWIRLTYATLFALVICYVLWYRSVKKVGNVRTAIYSNLVPVFGTLFGVWLLDERLTARIIIGAACILGAIVLARIDQRPR